MKFEDRLLIEAAQLEAMNEGLIGSFFSFLGSLVFGSKKLSDTDTEVSFNVGNMDHAKEAAEIIKRISKKYGGDIVEKPSVTKKKVVFPRISFGTPEEMIRFQAVLNG